VITDIADNTAGIAGWVFYDAECPFCREGARRFAGILARRRFQLLPLQAPGAAQRLGLPDPDLLREMRLVLADGRKLGGADAVAEIARHLWWAWPLWLASRLPGAGPALRAIYRVIAANRHCFDGECQIGRRSMRADATSRKAPRSGQPRRRHTAFFELP